MDEWHRRRASVHRPHCYGSRALLRDRLALDCASISGVDRHGDPILEMRAAWPSDRADIGRSASLLTLSRREQRHGFGKEVGRAITSFEDRHRVRRSNISAFVEMDTIRLSRE